MSVHEKPTTEHGSASHTPQAPIGVQGGGDEPPHHGMSIGEYIATRFTSLKPPLTKLPNPITLIRELNGHHWAFFMVAFFAWVCAPGLFRWAGFGLSWSKHIVYLQIEKLINTCALRAGMPSISSPSLLQSATWLKLSTKATPKSHGA